MAANHCSNRRTFGRGAWAAVILSLLLVSVASAQGPGESISPLQARQALRAAIDRYKSQDYEDAARYFEIAQSGQQGLSQTEMRDLQTLGNQNSIALQTRLDGRVQLGRAEEALKQGRLENVASDLKALKANQFLTTQERQQVDDLNRRFQAKSAVAAANGKSDAKSLLAAGREALKAGDFATAKAMAEKADKASSLIPAWMQPWNDSPTKLKNDIQAAEKKKSADMQAAEPKKDPAPNKLFNILQVGGASKKEPASKADEMAARHVMKDAYIFLQAGDLDKAQFLAMKVKELNVAWNTDEPNPDALLAEIQRRNGGAPPVDPKVALTPSKTDPKVAKSTVTKLPADTDPRTLLRHGRNLLAQKQYEEADVVCNQALAAKNANWGLFEDTPEKLRRDLQKARATNDRDEAVRLMVEARKLFTEGNLDEAERKAYRAKQLHGPYGVFDFGERPSKLLEDVQKTRQAKGLPNPMEKKQPTGNASGSDPFIPSNVQNRGMALVLLRKAGEFERQGMLFEARQQAIEARALKAPFSAEEESPDSMLSRLYARCDRQILAHLQQAASAINQTTDPNRLERAQAEITSARKLAQAFELDAGRIDQVAHYVQQVTGSRASASDIVPPTGLASKEPISTGDPQKDAARKFAREQLHQARMELSHGNIGQARKMAMQFYHPSYGVQDEVLALLRTVAAEEYNQQSLAAKRAFDAGMDAFLQKDFQKALFIFQAINPMMLPDQYQARLRDIMSTREMQPIMQAQLQGNSGGTGNPGGILLKGGPIDPKRAPTSEATHLEEVRAKETVQFQMLRQRGQEALRTAAQLYQGDKTDQKEQAIQTLRSYVEQVKLASLEPAKSNELCRMPEQRMQQYRMMMADAQLSKLQNKNMRYTSFHDEGKRQDLIRDHQQQIVERMKLVNELMKQNKLQEARVEVKKVREIDPENQAAIAADFMIQTRMNQKNWDDEVRSKERFLLDGLRADPGRALDTLDPIDINPKFAGQKKKSGSGEILHPLRDKKEREIEYRLRQPISLNFKDTPLQQALKDLTVLSGVQVVPDTKALREARVDLDSPLSFSVDNIDMKNALELMLKNLELTYTIQNQVLLITTPNNTVGRLVRVTYPIADLIVVVEDYPLPDVLNGVKAIERMVTPSMYPYGAYGNFAPSPFAYSNGMPVSSHGGGLGSAFGSHGPGPMGPGGTPAPAKDRSKEAMAEHLKTLIVNTVRKSTWEDQGGNGSIQYFPMGMALVINQPPEIQEEITILLNTLRRLQDLQVSVELRAVMVSETFFERIGVDFDMNIRTPTSRREPDLLNGTFVSAPFNNRFFDKLGGLVSGLTPAGTLTGDLNIPVRNSTFNFTTPQFGGYQPEAGLSLGLAFLSDIQVFMFLEAVQGDRRANIMQAPRITLFNGQIANIAGSLSRPTVTGVTPLPINGGANYIMQPQVGNMPIGLGMQVQAVVSPDRRYIRLNVQPILVNGATFLDPTSAPLLVFPSGAQGVFNSGQGQLPLPNAPLTVIQIQPQPATLNIVQTTVNVPDGGTVLLGGFKFLAEERTEFGPPILSKIPYLSRLFRNVGWSRDGATLIYLVTARIIMVEEEEERFERGLRGP